MNNKISTFTEQELKDLWRKEIDESASIQAYFADYEPSSVEAFLKMFLNRKYYLYTYEKRYAELDENENLKWVNEALEHIKIIQLKKLFDIECLWHAERVKLKEIKIAVDFGRWQRDILNCPFVDAATEQEIYMYCYYLNQSTIDTEFQRWHLLNHASYDYIKSSRYREDQHRFPEWFRFHNAQKGTEYLLDLPNIRGSKENFYKTIYHEDRRKNGIVIDERPSIMYYTNNYIEWFIKTFDNRKTLRLYKSYTYDEPDYTEEDLMIRVPGYITTLKDAKELLPIQQADNWVLALQKTAVKEYNKRIADAIYKAWEQYKINLELGIAFPVNQKEVDTYQNTIDWVTSIFLKARVLNGEPEDLNF